MTGMIRMAWSLVSLFGSDVYGSCVGTELASELANV